MKNTDEAGFSIVGTLLILVVVGILGFTGWYVYHSQKVSTKDYALASTQSAVVIDPYAGWKQNCSSAGNVCFKYPSGWTPTTTESGDPDPTVTGLSLKSPTGKAEVAYSPVLQGLGGACQPGICSIDVLSIGTPPASSDSNLRIVKAVFMNSEDSAFLPMYCVTSTSYLSQLDLKTGKQDIGLVYFTFPNPKSDHIEELCVNAPTAIVSTFKTENDAITWLSSGEVATGGKVLTSVNLQ